MGYQVSYVNILGVDDMKKCLHAHERLRLERESLGMTQDVFAEKVGVTRNTQGSYESGKRTPSADYLERAYALGVDITYVITGVPAKKDMADSHAIDESANIAVNLSKDEISPLVKDEKDQRVDYDELMRRLTLAPSDMTFMGKRIRFVRNQLRYSAGAIARMCNVSEDIWHEYEDGTRLIDSKVLHALSHLGGDILYILTGIVDIYTSKNVIESSLLMSFRGIPDNKKQSVLDYVSKQIPLESEAINDD